MIIEEQYSDKLIKTYSDSGYYIKQIETGIKYSEAVDVTPCMYTYIETTEPIPETQYENTKM